MAHRPEALGGRRLHRCIGDIGTHAFNLANYVTGLEVHELCAELSTFVAGRRLDDNVQVMLRYANGARGLLWASQVAPGNENALRLRVYGSLGGLAWQQEHPNQLHWSSLGQATQIIARGTAAANADAAPVTRIPSGNPEGHLEGFATIYGEIAQAIRAARSQTPLDPEVKNALDSNDAALAAQESLRQNQEAELARINKNFDDQLEKLRRLWAAPPGPQKANPSATNPR